MELWPLLHPQCHIFFKDCHPTFTTMKSVGGSLIEFHRCWRCECGAFGFFSSTWMLSASSHQRWVCPRFCLFLLVCFLCSVPTLFSDQSPLANWKCNYSPLHVTGGLSLQRNGNWRVVIVDQGWPLGARRLKGGRWCVSGFGHCSVCFLWWELGWSGGGALLMKSPIAWSFCGD